MPNCPSCGAKNIDGADSCCECEQPLDFLSKPQPSSDIEQCLHRDRIWLLSPRSPHTVPPSTPVSVVMKMMVERGIGCVVVGEDGHVAGIFSERDALTRVGSRAAELGDRPVSELMTRSVETLSAEDKIAWALHKMDVGSYRHLPILTDGRLSGIISVRDILRYVTDHLSPT
jgi:CBS domain-containing protein